MREYVGILNDDQTSANRGERERWTAEGKAGYQSLSISLCSACSARTEVRICLHQSPKESERVMR